VQFSNSTTAIRCSLSESCVEEITFNVKGFLDAVQYDVAYALNTSIHRVALAEHQFDGALPFACSSLFVSRPNHVVTHMLMLLMADDPQAAASSSPYPLLQMLPPQTSVQWRNLCEN
jgi:hypothetical protein